MPTQIVPLTDEGNFTGRNGYFKAIGIEVIYSRATRRIMITPITSKGRPGRCDITIPQRDAAKLIRALKEVTR